jgi:hypothetical protein
MHGPGVRRHRERPVFLLLTLPLILIVILILNPTEMRQGIKIKIKIMKRKPNTLPGCQIGRGCYIPSPLGWKKLKGVQSCC